jgi:hypothetical protein
MRTILTTIAILAVLPACGRQREPPPAESTGSPAVQAAAPGLNGPALIVTRRAGAATLDSARIIRTGPLVSTAGWTSWVVSYTTTVGIDDEPSLAAQSDLVFDAVRGSLAQRQDTTAFMEAHTLNGGYRFLYHKLPDGSWERVR